MPLPVNFTKSSQFLQEQLTLNLPKIYEVNYGKLWGLDSSLNFHSPIGDLPLGIENIDVWIKDNIGQIPVPYDGNSDDIPTVDVEIGKQTYTAVVFVLANEWNILQIEKERVAAQLNTRIPSLNLISAKQEAVGDFFNRGEHSTVLYGVPDKKVLGIFSQKGIATVDSTFSPYVKASGAYTLTTAELLEDLTDMLWSFVARAKLTSPAQIQMKIPPRLGRRLVEIYKTTAGESVGMTIQQMLKSSELGLGVSSIDVHSELAGENLHKYVRNDSDTGFFPTNRDRIVFKATSYNPKRHFYTRRPFTPPRLIKIHYEQITIGASTGILNPEPEFMMYYDFNNALA